VRYAAAAAVIRLEDVAKLTTQDGTKIAQAELLAEADDSRAMNAVMSATK
jgi:hypothetical protein